MTSESAAALACALHDAYVVVSRLSPADWSLPTPCSSWCTRDVLSHMVATTTKFSAFASGATDSPRTPCDDLLGNDPLGVLQLCMVGSADAWRSADWKRTCRLPFGTFTASEAADINTFDVLVHTWDIAHALDVPFEPLPELTKLAYRIATRLVTPQAVADGHYSRPADGGQAVGPPNWCDVLAMTGRQG